MVSDDFDEGVDEPNFNNPNTSPDPPSPYADLEKKYRRNKFNRKKNSYYPELYGTAGVTTTGSGNSNGNTSSSKKSQSQVGKGRKKKNSKSRRRPASGQSRRTRKGES